MSKPRFDSVNPPLSELPQRAAYQERAYLSLPVPFVEIRGRQALTDEQLFEDSDLAAFVRRFPDCFERDDSRIYYYFYPEGAPR